MDGRPNRRNKAVSVFKFIRCSVDAACHAIFILLRKIAVNKQSWFYSSYKDTRGIRNCFLLFSSFAKHVLKALH